MLRNITDISNHPAVLAIIRQALEEDIGNGDHTSLSSIEKDKTAKAKLIFKDNGVAAGLLIAHRILKINDPQCKITPVRNDGDPVKFGDIGFEAEGNAQALLRSERLLLNIMQRLSGIASITALACNKIAAYNTRLLDTRKTTPNLRILEKWAVTVGGGFNHRSGLYDMILLKDNHIDVAGGIIPAIQKAKQYLLDNHLDLEIEIETRNFEEIEAALSQLPLKRIMLDNFTPEKAADAVSLIDGRCETEASGGITLDNIEQYAATGVNFISLGMLTHSVRSLDISFKIVL